MLLKNSSKIKNLFLLFFLLSTFYFLLPGIPAQAANTTLPNIKVPDLQIKLPTLGKFSQPTTCETGKLCFAWIAEYIIAVYKYVVGIAGILASIVLMWGGVIWLTAGGNQQRVTEAQDWIKGSLTGLILLFSSYLILFEVNPDLINFQLIKVNYIKNAGIKSDSAPCTNATMYKTGAGSSTYIDYSSTPKQALPIACSNSAFQNYFKDYSGDRKIMLLAIAAQESTCNSATSNSSKGACGLMQMLPTTARIIDKKYLSGANFKNQTDDQICQILSKNPTLAIKLSDKFLDSYSLDATTPIDLFAAYNGGSAALLNSNDCRWEIPAYLCCVNTGGFAQTQNYVYNTYGYYKQLGGIK